MLRGICIPRYTTFCTIASENIGSRWERSVRHYEVVLIRAVRVTAVDLRLREARRHTPGLADGGQADRRKSRSEDINQHVEGGDTREECWRCGMAIGWLWLFVILGSNLIQREMRYHRPGLPGGAKVLLPRY